MKKRNTTLLGLTLLGCLLGMQVFAQVTVNMPFNTGVQQTFSIVPPNTCQYNFFDNGGAAGNYSSNSNFNLSVVTFAPSTGSNKIQASFSAFSTEGSWDALYVRDGATTGSPLISSGNGTTIGGFPAGGWWGGTAPNNTGTPGLVRATAANATGELTFQFASDASVVFAGWQAAITESIPGACAMTAPANITASTGATDCSANITTALPSFSPGGCQSAFQLQYRINGGTPIIVPQPVPATITIANVPKGTTVITWQLVNPCGGAINAQATQTINVVDLTPPVVTCPGNVTINLDPGACDVIYSYNVGLTDNCPFVTSATPVQFPASFVNHGNGTAFTLQGNTLPGGVYFDLTNNSATALTVTGFGIRFGNPQFGVVNAPQTMQIFTAPTFVGNETNAAAWTNIGPA
ncbi:MAG TPA: hypothetical protein PK228_10700, partial [Saprospiraceae bacterium]|nr:hypothetical protein [Saprospiraceae bacterium]